MHLLQQCHLRPAKSVDIHVDFDQIIKARGPHEFDFDRPHDKQHAIAILEIPLFESEIA